MPAADDSLGQKTESAVSLSALRGSILASVSRSFYLSIRLLPKKLRDPVSLGYLLARASDTIADTTEVAIGLRTENLRLVARGIQGEALGDAVVDLSASLAPLQTNKAERALIESLQPCLDWLDQSDVLDREEVRAVLEQINRGQILDLERFRNPKQIVALETAAELEEYTYLVAGSAGEFWTRLCFRHLPKFTERSEDEMLGMAKRYGMGLQLINILRDAGNDLRAGRCYFPNEELAVAAMEPSQILREPERFQPIYRKWREKAERGIEAGLQYARAIRNRRVRAATVLPALIGARTLALLHDAGATALRRHIKVPRREVRGIVASLVFGLAARSRIESLYRQLSR
ncbi:MAG TPA: squalene/phytoene synthase family protein [Chthoniobacterales bacterium]|jgi:farnesyl-diphosphate farnesyltransferase|nr:squalene/phytoene synthase family protein [Chthoniobacterales bacterium]